MKILIVAASLCGGMTFAIAGPVSSAPPVALAASRAHNRALDTPLIEAVTAGDVKKVEALLDRGADPSVKTADDDAVPMLCLSISRGNPLQICKLLVVAGADIEATDAHQDSALVTAAIAGETDAVVYLLKSGAHVDAAAGGGHTALMYAAASAHPDAVATLIKAGANVNARSADGMTPLILSASKLDEKSGDVAVARLLVDAGADVSSPMDDGSTPIKLAEANGFTPLHDYLDTIRKRDEELLQAAWANNWVDIKKLLAAGANPRYQTMLYEGEGDDVGWLGTSALGLKSDAPGFDADVAAKILARSDLEAHGKDGVTALLKAVTADDLVMTQLLLKAGANPNVFTVPLGETPLMIAAEYHKVEFVKALVEAGAKIELKSAAGETAETLASHNGYHVAIVDYLQKHRAAGQKIAPADEDLPNLDTLVAGAATAPKK